MQKSTFLKRMFSVFMTVIMLLVCAPLNVLTDVSIAEMFGITASAQVYSGTCGKNLKWKFDPQEKEITISGTGEMYNYDEEPAPWRELSDDIRSIVFEEGVTSIGAQAFECCDYLRTVSTGDGVISIGRMAFRICGNLETVNIGKNVKDFAGSAFLCCINIKTINVDPANKYFVSDEDSVMFDTSKTKLVLYPAGSERTRYVIPDSVRYIGDYSIRKCYNLTSVIIPSTVKEIGIMAFAFDRNLESVKIPNGVHTIGVSAFAYCEKLESVFISESVKTIRRDAFKETAVKDVYYGGTEKQWKAIAIQDSNEPLVSANIHYDYDDSYTIGDVNSDGKVNATDALVCLKHSVGKTVLEGAYFLAGDVDKNQKINSTDALKILQYTVGKISTL